MIGKLSGRKLLVVALPGSSEYADDVVSMLTMAGATITAQLAVHDRFFDPAAAYELLDLVHRTARPTVPIDGLPANSDAVETAGAHLTLALLQHPDSLPAPADVTAVLTAYAKADFLSVSDTATGGADGTVIISGEPFSDKHAAKMNQSAVALSTRFSMNKPLVIAGFGPGDGNLIAAVRRIPELAKTISTIDNAGLPKGQVATALATAERMVQGRVGQYGNDVGATSEVPKAAT